MLIFLGYINELSTQQALSDAPDSGLKLAIIAIPAKQHLGSDYIVSDRMVMNTFLRPRREGVRGVFSLRTCVDFLRPHGGEGSSILSS